MFLDTKHCRTTYLFLPTWSQELMFNPSYKSDRHRNQENCIRTRLVFRKAFLKTGNKRMLVAPRKGLESSLQRRAFLSWAISWDGQLSRTLGDKQSYSVSREMPGGHSRFPLELAKCPSTQMVQILHSHICSIPWGLNTMFESRECFWNQEFGVERWGPEQSQGNSRCPFS